MNMNNSFRVAGFNVLRRERTTDGCSLAPILVKLSRE
jgi:hypothetical protein